MLFIQLIAHHLKSISRNSYWSKNLLAKIIIVFAIIYLAIMLLAIGIFIDKALIELKPNQSPIITFCDGLFYFFICDFAFRFFLQSVPLIDALPYLRFKISKHQLTHYLLAKSLFTLLNIYPFIILLPFIFKVLVKEYDSFSIGIFFLNFILLMLFNHFLVVFSKYYAKKYFWANTIPWGFMFLIYTLVIYLPASNQFFFSLGNHLLNGNIYITLFIFVFLFGIYLVNYRLIKANFYVNFSSAHVFKNKYWLNTSFLEKYGEIGTYLNLELKLIWRNKRTRQMLYVSFFLLIYFVFTMFGGVQNSKIFSVFFCSVAPFAFTFSYGQFIFSWESTYFDGLMSKKVDWHRYISAKYYLLVFATIISYPAVAVAAFFMKIDFIMFNAIVIFNIGTNLFLILYIATYNSTKIDIAKGQMLNYQGTSLSNFIGVMLIMILPISFISFCQYLLSPTDAHLLLTAIGVALIAAHTYFLKLISRQFLRRKYKNLEGFRKLNG